MTKVIVDTSVWIENERTGIKKLELLLRENRVLLHWAIFGELAVGNIRNRKAYLSDLKLLDFCDEASPDETLAFIEEECLFAQGFSLVDCMILASAKKNAAEIFSLDKKLNNYNLKQ